MKNQLFKKNIPDDFFIKILKIYGIINVKEYVFTKEDLKKNNTLIKIIEIKKDLEKFYLPCKARTYLNDLNYNNIITILRHFLKMKNYIIKSSEEYFKGNKTIYYKIVSSDQQVINESKINIKHKKIIINFN